jgi:hypothetical protein
VQRYIVTVEAPNFTDVEEIELPRLPDEGSLIGTKYGMCIVTATEELPAGREFDGKIACRMP